MAQEASTSARQSNLPRDARLVALLLAQMGVQVASPAIMTMLMEFAHRYTTEILQDAQVYAEHASKPPTSTTAPAPRVSASNTTPSMDDVRLAIQAKVEQSFSQPWPKEFLLPLAATLNKEPLPPILDSYGVKLPPESERLTAINYNLIPRSKPTADDPYGMQILDSAGVLGASVGGGGQDLQFDESAMFGADGSGIGFGDTSGRDLFGDMTGLGSSTSMPPLSAAAFDPGHGLEQMEAILQGARGDQEMEEVKPNIRGEDEDYD